MLNPKMPLGSLSLDLDNLWSYMKTHGDSGWESFPSYFDIVVPRILEILENHNLEITFFIVGQDVALDKNHDAIRSIVDAGHEIGTHSFSHEPWLYLYSEQQFEEDLSKAEKHIERVTGKKPVGFRGPGYSFSPMVAKVIAKHGYQYDCSILPTYLGPLARAYYFMTTKLNSEEMENRKQLYGKFIDGFQPLRPYWWQVDGGGSRLLEIPVTTMPISKIPFHISYILYLSRFSVSLAHVYFRFSLRLCKLTRISPSLLLHPLDFLGCDDIEELSFFPAMDLLGKEKRKLTDQLLGIYVDNFHVVSISEHARMLSQENGLMNRPLAKAI